LETSKGEWRVVWCPKDSFIYRFWWDNLYKSYRELTEFGIQCDNYDLETYYLLGYELKKGNSPYDMFLDQNTEYVCDFNFI
jgi:hypothetical protein